MQCRQGGDVRTIRGRDGGEGLPLRRLGLRHSFRLWFDYFFFLSSFFLSGCGAGLGAGLTFVRGGGGGGAVFGGGGTAGPVCGGGVAGSGSAAGVTPELGLLMGGGGGS